MQSDRKEINPYCLTRAFTKYITENMVQFILSKHDDWKLDPLKELNFIVYYHNNEIIALSIIEKVDYEKRILLELVSDILTCSENLMVIEMLTRDYERV